MCMGYRKSVTRLGCPTVLFLILLGIPDATLPQSCHLSPASLAGCVSHWGIFLPPLSAQHGPVMVGAWVSAFSRALHLVLLLSSSCAHTICHPLPGGHSLPGRVAEAPGCPRLQRPPGTTLSPRGGCRAASPSAVGPHSFIPKAETQPGSRIYKPSLGKLL